MATKHTDGCFQKAEDDEPLFTLLARDPSAPPLVRIWARRRTESQGEDRQVLDAYEVARQMEVWCKEHRPGKAESLEDVRCSRQAVYEAALQKIKASVDRMADWPEITPLIGTGLEACSNSAAAALAWQPEGDPK